MKTNRPLIAVGYLMALLLVIVPIGEAIVSVWPLRPGLANWRFGAVGMFSQALMTPLLGVVLAGALALALKHRRFLRSLSLLAAVAAPAAIFVAGAFVLDMLQMRAQIRPEALPSYDMASAQALGRVVIMAVILGLAAFGGWKASRKDPNARRQKSGAAGPLLARQQQPADSEPSPVNTTRATAGAM